MRKRIGIIGAGYAGVSSARVLSAMGHDVVVYEKEPDIGGVWSSRRRYAGLTTQNTKNTYYLSEMKFPKHYPIWPNGDQVQAYMENYCDKFQLNDVMKTNCEVTKCDLNEDSQTWNLIIEKTNEDGTKETFHDEVQYLIVANGIFSIPSIPDYKGADVFRKSGGKLIHTSQFTNLEDTRHKHVLIVGYGKSSCDAARATLGIAKSTTVVARNLIWKMPGKLMNVLNFEHLMFTRLGEALFPYIKLRGFEKFLHGIGKPIRNSMLNSIQGVITRQLKLRELDLHPGKPFETIARSTVSLSTEGFYEAVKDGEIEVRKNDEIVELKNGQAVYKNGDVMPADVVICGTGWQQKVPFFNDKMTSRITDSDGNFRLYRSIIPVDVPNLAFNGYNSSFFSQLNCEIGALWIADMLHGGFKLPTSAEQNKYCDKRLTWMIERTDGKHSKGTNIIPFSVHQMDELLDDMNLTLNPFLRFVQWFGHVQPKSYRHLLGRLKARHQI